MTDSIINTIQEATPVVMEALNWDLIGDEYQREIKVGDEYDSELMSLKDAEKYCLDLNRLIKLLLDKGLNIFVYRLSLPTVEVETTNETKAMVENESVEAAALIAVARALTTEEK